MTSRNTTAAATHPSGGDGPPGPSPSVRWLAVAAAPGYWLVLVSRVLVAALTVLALRVHSARRLDPPART
ncbi:hypothetical protein [Streptomyces sp. Je 1-369]|uniref:hypothetical protein n=1 Tax=Streptomyces sp. Je 1-369 TaxID=2966192 RepID=UPI002285F949|nr:hypothetical protein [Streptomyces sp. Je 1-369]WAL99459.1 hypothetical protein NOO62_36280 [Streptomyces sp. Je 1-369]